MQIFYDSKLGKLKNTILSEIAAKEGSKVYEFEKAWVVEQKAREENNLSLI